MSPRFAPVLSAAFLLLVAAACTGTGAEPASPRVTAVAVVPTPTPVPTPTRAPEPTPTASVNAGDVDGWGDGPQLTVEQPGQDLLDVTLEDADAKAWRVVVAGMGVQAQDRLEVVVETGDVGPVITATEVQQGDVIDTIDLSSYVDETATAGGCHHTLEVCIDSSSFRFSDDGTGRLRIRLQMPNSRDHMMITGATAAWAGEPFVLGPWSETEAFPWGDEG